MVALGEEPRNGSRISSEVSRLSLGSSAGKRFARQESRVGHPVRRGVGGGRRKRGGFARASHFDAGRLREPLDAGPRGPHRARLTGRPDCTDGSRNRPGVIVPLDDGTRGSSSSIAISSASACGSSRRAPTRTAGIVARGPCARGARRRDRVARRPASSISGIFTTPTACSTNLSRLARDRTSNRARWSPNRRNGDHRPRFPVAEVDPMVRENESRDAASVAAWHLAAPPRP